MGGWVKGKVVGSGSFGSVHLAINKSNGGLFVVKSANSEAGRHALHNEFNILNTLNYSPYIVQCLGTEYQHQGAINNVFMEYMSGGSLADVAHNFGGSLDEQLVRLYTKHILLGLNHLHQHGIVHCDLKCKNVLLASSGNVKLADFGCARRIKSSSSSSSSSCCGTPLWMAPEVLLLHNNTNEKLDLDLAAADIWSLGCTVIEMATGRPPWIDHLHDSSTSNPMAALFKIARGNAIPQFPLHFSKEGIDFLSRCLERDPNKRSTAHDLLSHPFINLSTHHKHCSASSPAAVLEVHKFEHTYDDFDVDVDSDDKILQQSPTRLNHFHITNQFLCSQLGTTIWQLEDRASGNHWITIRSRS